MYCLHFANYGTVLNDFTLANHFYIDCYYADFQKVISRLSV